MWPTKPHYVLHSLRPSVSLSHFDLQLIAVPKAHTATCFHATDDVFCIFKPPHLTSCFTACVQLIYTHVDTRTSTVDFEFWHVLVWPYHTFCSAQLKRCSLIISSNYSRLDNCRTFSFVALSFRDIPKIIFIERELTFTFAICHRPSVCSSVTFVHATQAI